jgi:hypothetical protein
MRATFPVYLILLDLITLIMLGRVQVLKIFIKQFSPASSHFIHRWSSTLFSNVLSLCYSLNVRDQVLHPYKTTRKLCFHIF